jgi:hypothetical protein
MELKEILAKLDTLKQDLKGSVDSLAVIMPRMTICPDGSGHFELLFWGTVGVKYNTPFDLDTIGQALDTFDNLVRSEMDKE